MQNPKLIQQINTWSYYVPTYIVANDGIQDGMLINLTFCRDSIQDENIPRQDGVFTESLLQVCKQYLEGVNKGELATHETSMAITKIDEALMWIQKRSDDRKLREVQGK